MPDKKSLVELLPDLIAKDFHLSLSTEGTLCITETKSQASCRWVEFNLKQSVPCFGFSIDKSRKIGEGDPIFPFFNPKKEGICSKNDAFLVCQKKQQIYVLLIELKSGDPGKYLKQLRAAQAFFQFIIARIKLHYHCSHSLDNIQFRGLLFSCRQIVRDKITKRQKIEFKVMNNLPVTKQNCNQTYNLQTFLS